MKAMILAAGEGRRMAPLTERCAKPALPVLDEPLVLRLVRSLAGAGIERAVVNAHTLPGTLREALLDAPIPVDVSLEAELLGRGGGIRAARRFLADAEPFLVLNGDMCLELDVPSLLAAHAAGGALVTLGLRDDPRKRTFGSIGYDPQRRVCRVTDRFASGAEAGSGLFIGVHVLEPAIFDLMPAGGAFDILTDVYLPLLRSGKPIAAWLQDPGSGWWPVGSPAELLDVNLELLERRLGRAADAVWRGPGARIDGSLEGPAWVGAGAQIERGARVGPRVVVGAGVRIGGDSRVTNSLLLPAACPPAGLLDRAIAYGNEVWRGA